MRLCELHPDVLEAMLQLLKVILPVVFKDVQVGGEVLQLNLSQFLTARNENDKHITQDKPVTPFPGLPRSPDMAVDMVLDDGGHCL